ncbi:unnamed protein product [Sordaria macrospora k-hell]|uniref:WGS project CABT00000000 data, contig 2.48 n=1 Tax=Sordaria macrospora (strain ATCC MYA-333 / DSM 997 / K(L3346) / K-hell) TaxID=771870 RepID=F7W927_SORMK|nr:uncharacterized protein SMAC_07978 [Sordaria macrospora k-hell]CCC13908.1 unnamed protein product [Sordaria macrospora k-hell]
MKSSIAFCSAAIFRLALGQSTAGSGTTFWQAAQPSSTGAPSTWTPRTTRSKPTAPPPKETAQTAKPKPTPSKASTCLPANANPKEETASSMSQSQSQSPNPHYDSSSSSGKSISGLSRFFSILSSRTHMGQNHAAAGHEQNMNMNVDGNGNGKMMHARQAPSNATNAGNDGGSCNTLATAGNRIELLCACGGNCLNPVSDHIGRCDAAC